MKLLSNNLILDVQKRFKTMNEINNLHDGDDKEENVVRKAGRGIVWNLLTYGLGKGAVLVTTSILARMLTKDDFGLVSIAVIAINYLSIIKDLGLGVALIQKREDIESAANTVFLINFALGIFLSAVTYPMAPWVATYFNEPMVTPVLRWLGVSFVINAMGSVHIVLLQRDMDYRRKFIPDFGNTVVKAFASIGFAYAGFGVWSLVLGQLLGTAASSILVWIILPWRPVFSFDKEIAKNLMKFGSSIIGGDILSFFIDNIDYILVGKIFGVTELSIYTLAFRLPETILIGNLWVMGGVVFPAFSKLQNKPEEMKRGLLASIRIVQIIAVPISLGLIVAADPIIRVAFGEQWLDSVPLLRVLAIYAWIYSLGYHVGDIYKAIGRPDILLKLSIFTLIVLVPSLLLGSLYGVIGVACGHILAVVIRRVVSLYVATKYVNINIYEVFGELMPAITGGFFMSVIVGVSLLVTKGLNPFIQLPILVIAGTISYIGVLYRIEKDNILRLIRMIGIPL